MPRSLLLGGVTPLIAIAVVAIAPRAGAQGVHSAVQSIGLIAFKPPAAPALQTVQVSGWGVATDAATHRADARGAIVVRETLPCEIWVGATPGSGAAVVDDAGAETPISDGAPVLAFRGTCEATGAAYRLHLRALHAARVEVSVVERGAAAPRRWVVDVAIPAPLS